MSLTTPPTIRSLQRKLYVKAKEEPSYRFYSLYDKIHRPDILARAYRLAKAQGGAPGVDGETFEEIEEQGLADWQERLGEELRTRRYRPAAVRRVYLPKPGGGERPLGIPTVRDRVARAYGRVEDFLLHRARGFLVRRHKAPGRGVRRFPADGVFGDGGLVHLSAARRAARLDAGA